MHERGVYQATKRIKRFLCIFFIIVLLQIGLYTMGKLKAIQSGMRCVAIWGVNKAVSSVLIRYYLPSSLFDGCKCSHLRFCSCTRMLTATSWLRKLIYFEPVIRLDIARATVLLSPCVLTICLFGGGRCLKAASFSDIPIESNLQPISFPLHPGNDDGRLGRSEQ